MFKNLSLWWATDCLSGNGFKLLFIQKPQPQTVLEGSSAEKSRQESQCNALFEILFQNGRK